MLHASSSRNVEIHLRSHGKIVKSNELQIFWRTQILWWWKLLSPELLYPLFQAAGVCWELWGNPGLCVACSPGAAPGSGSVGAQPGSCCSVTCARETVLDSPGAELQRYLKGHSAEPAWLERTFESFQGRGSPLTFKIRTKLAAEALAALSLLPVVDRVVCWTRGWWGGVTLWEVTSCRWVTLCGTSHSWNVGEAFQVLKACGAVQWTCRVAIAASSCITDLLAF